MKYVYHVVPKEWDGSDIEPLAERIGLEEAVQTFLAKWEHEGGIVDPLMAERHVQRVFLHSSLAQAREYAGYYGGIVLKIDPEELDYVERDEYEGELFTNRVPAEAIIDVS
jgi:hypothetical protein